MLTEFRECNRVLKLKTKFQFLSPPEHDISNAPKLESRDRTFSSLVYSQNASVSSFNEDSQNGGGQLL